MIYDRLTISVLPRLKAITRMILSERT